MSQHSDPSYTPPRTQMPDLIPEVGEVPNQIQALYSMVQSLTEKVTQLSQVAQVSERLSQNDRSPKLVIPMHYDGSADDFDVFWGDVNDYLLVKSSSFKDDFTRITFISGLLKGFGTKL